jgi:hypothetical protein
MTIPNRYRVTVLAMAMVLATALLAVVLAKPAWADDTQCVGFLTGVHDNVVVPPGATCFLNNATVNGNVKALQDSRLFMTGDTVFGNVEGDKAENVSVRNSVVRQNILIKEGETPGPGFNDAIVCATTVQEGNIQVEKMAGEIVIGAFQAFCQPNIVEKGTIKVEDNLVVGGAFFGLQIRQNQVAQNLQVFKNKGPGAPKVVQGNTVGQDLQCFENDQPFIGGPNAAQKAEGQCF